MFEDFTYVVVMPIKISDCPVYIYIYMCVCVCVCVCVCGISKNNYTFIVHVSMYVYCKLHKSGFYDSEKKSEPT
jgi:hypothetical protein